MIRTSWVSGLQLLSAGLMSVVLLLLTSGVLYAPAAHAANGQCKWEGGAGAPTYPACRAEDCIGNGGTALCTAGDGAATNSNYPDSQLGPDKWVNYSCDPSASNVTYDARWCRATGGTWSGSTQDCTNMPAGFLGTNATTANDDQLLVQTGSVYFKNTTTGASCPVASDTGWGTTISSSQCWGGSPTYKLGIPIGNLRQLNYSGPSCGGTVYLLRQRDANCPAGYRTRTATSGVQCFLPLDCCGIGNPISPLSGAKTLAESDYEGRAGGGLQVRRYYRSTGYYRPYQLSTPIDATDHALTRDYWRHSYDRRLYAIAGNAQVSAIIQRPDGSVQQFDTAGHEIANVDGAGAVLQIASGGGWDLTLSNSDIEHYNGAGRLTSIETRAGMVTTLTYDSAGLLATVTDAFGHALVFGYNSKSLLAAVTLPDGGQVQYAYDNWDRLSTVTYPDTTSRTYTYGDARNGWLVTAIQDESGQSYASYTYDAQGRAVSESHGSGAEPYSFVFNPNGTGSTVTDPTGTVTQWAYFPAAGVLKASARSQPCRDCGTLSSATYDAQGNPATRTDFNGNQSLFIYDSTRNLEISRTEASGTPRARVVTTQWHATFREPVQIDEPGRRTTFTYDVRGNLLSRTIMDLATNATRTWTYTYNAVGQVLTANGPRTDVGDVTTYTHNDCASGYGCGQLATVTDAVGHVTSYLTYDANGNPLTISDSNGLVTTLTYDTRQRITSDTIGTETTTYEYWPTGLLKKLTLPDGSYTAYTYDDAHRLIQLADGQGNHIAYSLDLMGNITGLTTYDPQGTLSMTLSREYNTLGQLWKDKKSAGTPAVTTTFGYDNNGNQTAAAAPLGRNTTLSYDELNRLRQVTDPMSGVTTYGYNANDDLVSVTDPRSLTTAYDYNGFSDLVSQNSPDTGTTSYTYDSGGNLQIFADARSTLATYSYDALNRVTQVAYSAGGSTDQTLSFTYDDGTNGKGRLTGASDASHSLDWTYDAHGRVTSRTQTIGGVTKSLSYAYTNGELTSLTTPSGQTITYAYSNGQPSSISINGTTLLNGVEYEPFSGVRRWSWGNGSNSIRLYDADGVPSQISGAETLSYSRDDAARLTAVSNATSPQASWSYGYDALDRLTGASGASVSLSWSYDANGNRLNQGAPVALSPGNASFAYSNRGRLMSVMKNGISTSYDYNALGERIRKIAPTGTTLFLYDEQGHLIGEYSGSGALIQEIVWLDELPVASLRPSGSGVEVFYIHSDHLGTPRLIIRPSDNAVRWRWDADPFGTAPANQNPVGLGTFVFNLRFPGQYFDVETGLNYNYFRDYDPAAGRYVQSDPIGLTGGMNTYAYAAGNPVSNFDPSGLECASIGGFIYCTYPDGGPSFRFPTQPGFPDFLGGDDFGNFMRYHKYDESVPLGSADAECVMKKLVENPTPQGGKPATKNGTRNNAAVFEMDNWITSYLTSDLDTHAPIVVNTTDSNSRFYPGYVARTVRNGVVHTYGEGLALSQAVPGPQGFGNWFYWKRQMEKIVQECSCKK